MPPFSHLGNKNTVIKVCIIKKNFALFFGDHFTHGHWNNFTGRVRKAGNVFLLCVGKSWYRQVKQLTPKRQWLANLSSVSTLRTLTFLSTSNVVCYRGDKINDLDCDHVNIARWQLQLCFSPTNCLQNVFSVYAIINEGKRESSKILGVMLVDLDTFKRNTRLVGLLI